MINRESTNTLFVYTRDDSGNFWVFDGFVFHRFLWTSEGLWFIRSQPYLPACSFGQSLTMTRYQRLALEDEAMQHHVSLPFFANEAQCNNFAIQSRQNQFVFDCTVPSGYFYLP